MCIYTRAHTYAHPMHKIMFISEKENYEYPLICLLICFQIWWSTILNSLIETLKQHFLEFRNIRISLKSIVVIYPIHTLQNKSLTKSVAVSYSQTQWLHTLTLGRARNSFQVRFCDVFVTSLRENCDFFFKKKLNLGTLKMTYLCVFHCQVFISFLHMWALLAVGLSISTTAPPANVLYALKIICQMCTWADKCGNSNTLTWEIFWIWRLLAFLSFILVSGHDSYWYEVVCFAYIFLPDILYTLQVYTLHLKKM